MDLALIITSEHSTRLPFSWFLKSKNLQSSQYASHPVILRAAKGGVAESIIQKTTLALRERGDRHRRWVRALEEYFPPLLICPNGHLLPKEKVFLHFL